MGKAVIKGRGVLITGACPQCQERVCVLLKEGERFRNSKCDYCGVEIHGDWIDETVHMGHKNLNDKAQIIIKPADKPLQPVMHAELVAYDKANPGNHRKERKHHFRRWLRRAKEAIR